MQDLMLAVSVVLVVRWPELAVRLAAAGLVGAQQVPAVGGKQAGALAWNERMAYEISWVPLNAQLWFPQEPELCE